jgi:hypothetical protein
MPHGAGRPLGPSYGAAPSKPGQPGMGATGSDMTSKLEQHAQQIQHSGGSLPPGPPALIQEGGAACNGWVRHCMTSPIS